MLTSNNWEVFEEEKEVAEENDVKIQEAYEYDFFYMDKTENHKDALNKAGRAGWEAISLKEVGDNVQVLAKRKIGN